jgi:hypothetical protein
MAKANPSKVPYNFGETLIATKKDLGSLYSEAVRLSYQTSGRFAPSFDAKDLVAWIRLNHPDLYDEKGHRINK